MGIDIYFIIALVIAITIHEFSHAFAANYFGDPTAKYHGRMTLNPLAHLDLFGTIMLFLVGLGWGKPVPVNYNNLYHPKRDSALVSLAGPVSNILLALAISLPYKYVSLQGTSPALAQLFGAIFDLNLILAIFNLIPLPPLDGSKIIGIFIPQQYYGAYQHFLMNGVKYFIAVILVDTFILQNLFGVSILWKLLSNIFVITKSLILFGT